MKTDRCYMKVNSFSNLSITYKLTERDINEIGNKPTLANQVQN